MSALDLLNDCLDILDSASKRGHNVDNIHQKLENIALELNFKLEKINENYSRKIRMILSTFSNEYTDGIKISRQSLDRKSGTRANKSLYSEMIEICQKIEKCHYDAQEIVNSNKSNIKNIDDITKKLNELSLFNYKAKKIKERQATTSSKALNIIEDLTKMLDKSNRLAIEITKDSSPNMQNGNIFEKSNKEKRVSFSVSAESTKILEEEEEESSSFIVQKNPSLFIEKNQLKSNEELVVLNPNEKKEITPESVKDMFKNDSIKANILPAKEIEKSSIINFESLNSDLNKSKLENSKKVEIKNNDQKSKENEEKTIIEKPKELFKVSQNKSELKVEETETKPGLSFGNIFSRNLDVNQLKKEESSNLSKSSSIFSDKNNEEVKKQENEKNNKSVFNFKSTKDPAPVGNLFSNVSQSDNQKSELIASKPLNIVDSSSISKGKNLEANIIEQYSTNRDKSKILWNKSTDFSRNQSIDQAYILSIKKFINMSINTLSRNSGIEIIKRSKNFSDFFNNKLISTLNGEIDPNRYSNSTEYGTFLLFKNIQSQIENIISASNESAFPICILVNSLFVSVPQFLESFKSYFLYKYPLFNTTIPPLENIVKIEEISQSINSKSYNESQKTQFLDSICKQYESASIFMSLASSIDLPKNFSKSLNNIDLYGFLWSLLTNAIASLKSNTDLSLCIIYGLLHYSGSNLSKIYGRQFSKLMNLISNFMENYLSNDDQQSNLSSLALINKVKIEDICREFKEKQSFKIPEGSFTESFWLT